MNYCARYYQEHKEQLQRKSRENYYRHREERIAYEREYHKAYGQRSALKWRHQIKVEVLTHYGNGSLACVRCGFDDIRALSIDHVVGKGNEERKTLKLSGYAFYSWLKKNNYPEGYQTLCMNCQVIKRQERREYGGNKHFR